jgi:hypothetical protein
MFSSQSPDNNQQTNCVILTSCNRSRKEIMRRAHERFFRYYHKKWPGTITQLTKLTHVILTAYNRSKIETMGRATKKILLILLTRTRDQLSHTSQN